jgi:hypothetical protein
MPTCCLNVVPSRFFTSAQPQESDEPQGPDRFVGKEDLTKEEQKRRRLSEVGSTMDSILTFLPILLAELFISHLYLYGDA